MSTVHYDPWHWNLWSMIIFSNIAINQQKPYQYVYQQRLVFCISHVTNLASWLQDFNKLTYLLHFSNQQWCSQGGTKYFVKERRSTKWHQDKGERRYSSVPQVGLQRNAKSVVSWFSGKWLKLLPPDKRRESKVGERRGEKGRGGERNEQERRERGLHSTKFATTPNQYTLNNNMQLCSNKATQTGPNLPLHLISTL